MAEQKASYKRPSTGDPTKEKAAGPRTATRNRLTLRTIGSPDPNLVVKLLVPLILSEAGKK